MTSCSTLLALGMMPLLLYLYCQGFPNVQEAVPYVEIIISLVAILVPCGIGILINYFRPHYSKIITKVGGIDREKCLLVFSYISLIYFFHHHLIQIFPQDIHRQDTALFCVCSFQVGLSILMISILVVSILSSIDMGGSLLSVLSPPLMAIAALMPLIGYTCGYLISSVFRLNQK